MPEKTGLVFSISSGNEPGVLYKALNVLARNNINLTRIESKPSKTLKYRRGFDFFIDFYGAVTDRNVANAISELKDIASDVHVLGTPEVPWFPTHIMDLDKIGKTVLKEGEGIQEADHPGFRDPEYRQRRDYISQVALEYSLKDESIPRI